MIWILGSIEPNLVLNLQPLKTAAEMWTYLKKIYNQSNIAQRFQLELDLSTLQQESLFISDFCSKFMNIWAEYTDIVYATLPNEALINQFMKLQKKYNFL